MSQKPKVLVVDVEDHTEEDILAHFGKCVAFIDEARAAGSGVLVYCTAGRRKLRLLHLHRSPFTVLSPCTHVSTDSTQASLGVHQWSLHT